MEIKRMQDKIQKAHGAVQQMSEGTLGKLLMFLGGSGSLYDFFNDFTPWIDLFIKYGNGFLICGGGYMMVTNVSHRIKKRRRHRDRATDSKIKE